jgi:anaerobic selenocysteine-containing dehydrogenase
VPEIRPSVCALDCPDTCALLVRIEDGKATRLRGDPAHPVTRGFLCAKVTKYLDRVYSPDRLLYPMKRTGAKGQGRFERIGWDEALDTIAERLRAISAEWGPEAILPYSYAGTMGLLNYAGMDRRFFHRLGASRLERTICSAAGEAAMNRSIGFRVGTDPEQFRHARLILAWGANILGTNVHLWPFIVEARRNGARFYTIDPVKNRTGAAADRHYFIHPGSDQALAFGLAHILIREKLYDADYVARYTTGFEAFAARVREYPPERVEALTGIAAQDVVQLAREYATTRPAVIRLNYGVQRSERGGASVQAISLLPALTGSWREVGGGLLLSGSQAFKLDRESLMRGDLQMASPLGRVARAVNMSQLGSALTRLDDPPVKALVVYNSNPAAIAPDQNRVLAGLRRDDLFTVVLEQMPTDTADYADILLPATTFLEHTDLYTAYGHYYLQLARPVLEAPGETRSNVEVFRSLARRMGFDDPCFTESEDDMIRAVLASGHPFLEGITLERLEQQRFLRLNFGPPGTPFQPFAHGGFATPSGKCELDAGLPDYTPPTESRLGDPGLRARYPLELIPSKNDDSMNSTFGHRDWVDQQTALLEMSEADAAPRGIRDRDQVRVFNDRGEFYRQASVNGTVTAGVVRAPSTRWNRKSPCGRGTNTVISERLTDIGGGPTLYSCLVQVEKVEPALVPDPPRPER